MNAYKLCAAQFMKLGAQMDNGSGSTTGRRLTIDLHVGLRGLAAGTLDLLLGFGGRRSARWSMRDGPAVGSVRAPQEQEEQSARHANDTQTTEQNHAAMQVHIHLAVEEQRHEQGTRK